MLNQNEIDTIYKLYPNVIKTIGDTAYDVDGKLVTYDKKAVQAYADSQAYISKRQAAYPSMADYLDAIVKGDTTQQQAYIDACLAVKAKYPKSKP